MNFRDLQALLPNIELWERSVVRAGGETYLWAKDAHQHYFLIVHDPQLPAFQRDTFSGEVQDFSPNLAVKWCLPSSGNARKLRRFLPWTAPQPLGLKRSFGCGDRLGLANAAHIRATRECGLDESVGLVLAQTSPEEMSQASRRPDEVLDAATWAVFQEGWRHPWGADADRLKTVEDARRMAEAGFTMFTIDPSEFVDDNVESYGEEELRERFEALPDARKLRDLYDGVVFDVEVFSLDATQMPPRIAFDAHTRMRAALKYGRAIQYAANMARVLAEAVNGSFDVEISVDETASPTTLQEHFFIANELKRRDINFSSLALRFVGDFEKGINYEGDLKEFTARLQEHVQLAWWLVLGQPSYKLSVHSGSDKFAVYPALGKICGDLLHVKTAGTWWLEALRCLAQVEPTLFAEIVTFAKTHFGEERAPHHVVEDLRDLPDVTDASLLDNDVARQMLHVTFGSILSGKDERGRWLFRDRIYRALLIHEEAHFAGVAAHAKKHFGALGWCQ